MTAPHAALDRVGAAWASSGVMALSGPPPGGTTGPPERLVDGVLALGRRIEAASAAVGTGVRADWLAMLGERAALDGLVAGGRRSCGGATRLLRCADGWVAVALARAADVELVPAWLACSGAEGTSAPLDPSDPFPSVAAAVAQLPGTALVEASALLGLPVGLLGERLPDPSSGVELTARRHGSARRSASLRVLDLSVLWAGPLCASLLAAAGAQVTKVESPLRPDASRDGSPGLYRLLNGAKQQIQLDLTAPAGREALARLISEADVVVESARPRALEQLGIVAADQIRRPGGPSVWVSITGHGRSSPRVAFGDDAAVAGGLVTTTDDGPWFCADAAADPLAGLAAAAAALELLADGEQALVDVAMSGVAAAHGGPTLPAPAGPCRPPRARAAAGPA